MRFFSAPGFFSPRLAAPVLLAAVAAITAFLFERSGHLPFTSDQGIISLIAKDILERGVHPVFCYGSTYGGTLEPHYLAVVFALCGQSAASFHLGMGLLYVLLVLAVAALGQVAYGARAGFFAGLYVALGPAYLVYKGLSSDGAYTSLLLLLTVCLALLLRIDGVLDRPEPGLLGSPPLLFALLGIAAGLAWWVHPLSIVIGPGALVLVAISGPRRWLRPSHAAALLAGFAAGALPWWVYNLRHGWASLKAREMAPATTGKAAHALLGFFAQGLPRILGARAVWRRGTTFPGAVEVSLLLAAVLLGFAVYRLLRSPGPSGRSARHASALLLTLAAFLPFLCVAVARTDFREPRYLLPFYLAVAPLAGGLLDALWRRRTLFAVAVAVLLALGVGSELRATRFRNFEMTFFESDPYRLIDGLEKRGVRAVYTSYWAAYRLEFLAHGSLAATPFGSGYAGQVRDPRRREAVDASASPGLLLCCEDLIRLKDFLARTRTPHRVEPLEGFELFTGLPAEALAALRACYCIPESPRAGDLVWRSIDGPRTLAAGGEATYRVAFGNLGKQPLSSNVHLSYHWLRPDGGVAHFDGARSELPYAGDDWWLHPWREVSAPARVLANVPPGEYRLVFDLVDESVSWFEGYGFAPAPYRVVVTRGD